MSPSKKKEAKDRIADYVLSEIINHTNAQTSPVTGEEFKGLSSDYKKKKKAMGKGDVANLQLHGDLLDSININRKANALEFQITDALQKKKAYNHTVGDTVPKRPLLPNDELASGKHSKFSQSIMDGVNEIARSMRADNS